MNDARALKTDARMPTWTWEAGDALPAPLARHMHDASLHGEHSAVYGCLTKGFFIINASRNMNRFQLGACCALFFLIPVASATEGGRLQYNYVEGGYARAEIDVLGDIDANLYSIGGSFAVTDDVFVQGAYERTEFEKILGVDVSANTFQVGSVGTCQLPIAPT